MGSSRSKICQRISFLHWRNISAAAITYYGRFDLREIRETKFHGIFKYPSYNVFRRS